MRELRYRRRSCGYDSADAVTVGLFNTPSSRHENELADMWGSPHVVDGGSGLVLALDDGDAVL